MSLHDEKDCPCHTCTTGRLLDDAINLLRELNEPFHPVDDDDWKFWRDKFCPRIDQVVADAQRWASAERWEPCQK